MRKKGQRLKPTLLWKIKEEQHNIIIVIRKTIPTRLEMKWKMYEFMISYKKTSLKRSLGDLEVMGSNWENIPFRHLRREFNHQQKT